jgi:hypothetical protein
MRNTGKNNTLLKAFDVFTCDVEIFSCTRGWWVNRYKSINYKKKAYFRTPEVSLFAYPAREFPFTVESAPHGINTMTQSIDAMTHSIDSMTHSIDPMTHNIDPMEHGIDPIKHSIDPMEYSIEDINPFFNNNL